MYDLSISTHRLLQLFSTFKMFERALCLSSQPSDLGTISVWKHLRQAEAMFWDKSRACILWHNTPRPPISKPNTALVCGAEVVGFHLCLNDLLLPLLLFGPALPHPPTQLHLMTKGSFSFSAILAWAQAPLKSFPARVSYSHILLWPKHPVEGLCYETGDLGQLKGKEQDGWSWLRSAGCSLLPWGSLFHCASLWVPDLAGPSRLSKESRHSFCWPVSICRVLWHMISPRCKSTH